jgi:RimJ/RimL family protein N-acetyltransferase
MIQLQLLSEADFAHLISWVDSEETLMQFAGPAFAFPLTAHQLHDALSDPRRTSFKVVDHASGEMIGHAELYLATDSVYLGRILIGDPTLRRQGIGSMIVKILLKHAFMQWDVDIVQLNVFDWNTPAIRCYQKAGFAINPDKKATRSVSGKIWTALNMNITKAAWTLMQ